MKNIILAGIILLSSNIFAAEKKPAQIIEVKVTEKGFEPSEINVTSEIPERSIMRFRFKILIWK